VPGGPPCSPEWLSDAGTTPSNPDDDILALVLDALTLSLSLTRDALTVFQRPPPTPDLLHGTRWELGMVGLMLGPTPLGDKVRTNGTKKAREGLPCGLSLTGARTLLLSRTPDNQPTKTRRASPPPTSTHTRGTGRPRDRDGGDPGTHTTPRDLRDTEGS